MGFNETTAKFQNDNMHRFIVALLEFATGRR